RRARALRSVRIGPQSGRERRDGRAATPSFGARPRRPGKIRLSAAGPRWRRGAEVVPDEVVGAQPRRLARGREGSKRPGAHRTSRATTFAEVLAVTGQASGDEAQTRSSRPSGPASDHGGRGFGTAERATSNG